MFDIHHVPQPSARPAGAAPLFANPTVDQSLPFVLTMASQDLGAALAGEAACVELDRFATLAEAVLSAVTAAGETESDSASQMLAILDRDQRLVLAGAITGGAIAWCHPVLLAPEARAVVTEASQLRGQASRAMEWKEHVLALSLRHRADVLEARLVDPLWRAFTARTLEVAA